MAHAGAPTAQALVGGPKPAYYQPVQAERSEQKRDLASWWKNFKRSDRDKKAPEQHASQGIFGIPLAYSIRYANVAISLLNDEGQSYIYGYVPIVVAKCGVFLKEKATDVEGIFRLAGSEKRIKELKVAFDSPDRYGKGLDWTGYTVHDAANILRRYFNQLPEPIIPLEFYQPFRDPLRNHQAEAVGSIESQSPSVGDFDQDAVIRVYQRLITELPPLNRQLLLYILDLLAVFASKSDLNKMTTGNLAAIFQPGILRHPNHDMAPLEYRLSQDVLIFLIENQDSFLIGMQGTGADPETIRDVQSGIASPRPPGTPGTPTGTPNRAKTVIGRSTSNASAGSASVRKWSNVRRNVSVSSKHSKQSDGGPVPVGTPTTPTSTGSVHRSNTVPSRRGGSNGNAQGIPRFSREKSSDPPTPNLGGPTSTPPTTALDTATLPSKQRPESLQNTPIATSAPHFPPAAVPRPPDVTSASSSEATTPLAQVASDTSSAANRDDHLHKRDTSPLLASRTPNAAEQQHATDRSAAASNTPSTASGRGFLDIFKQSPTSDSESAQRRPNKLQKKRIPGSSLSSAQSSNHSLHSDGPNEAATLRSPQIPAFPASALAAADPTDVKSPEHGGRSTAHDTLATAAASSTPPPPQGTPQRNPTDATLKPSGSPTHSYHSTDLSDADLAGDDLPREQSQQPEKEKKRHRWRFSRSQNKLEPSSPPPPLGTWSGKDQMTSRSTIGSNGGGAQPRRSFQESGPLSPTTTTDTGAVAANPVGSPPPHTQTMQSTSSAGDRSNAADPAVFSDSERDGRKGPLSWIRGKMQERKDSREMEKRARTPDRGGGDRLVSRESRSSLDRTRAGSDAAESGHPAAAVAESEPVGEGVTESRRRSDVDVSVAAASADAGVGIGAGATASAGHEEGSGR